MSRFRRDCCRTTADIPVLTANLRWLSGYRHLRCGEGPGRRSRGRRSPGTGVQIGQTLTAWIAKDSLRNFPALARTSADRRQVGRALTWCADPGIPEVVRPAVTVDRSWTEIAAFPDTGHSTAKSEGINRMIKLVARRTPSASATQTINAYAHAATPPAEPADTSAPLNIEDPQEQSVSAARHRARRETNISRPAGQETQNLCSGKRLTKPLPNSTQDTANGGRIGLAATRRLYVSRGGAVCTPRPATSPCGGVA